MSRSVKALHLVRRLINLICETCWKEYPVGLGKIKSKSFRVQNEIFSCQLSHTNSVTVGGWKIIKKSCIVQNLNIFQNLYLFLYALLLFYNSVLLASCDAAFSLLVLLYLVFWHEVCPLKRKEKWEYKLSKKMCFQRTIIDLIFEFEH